MYEVNSQEAELLDESDQQSVEKPLLHGPALQNKPNAKRKRYGAQPE
jgi:hypothetical protein